MTGPIRDLGLFARTAFSLSRCGVPAPLLRVYACVEGDASGVLAVLRSYSASYRRCVVSLAADPDGNFPHEVLSDCLPLDSVRVHLRPDAVLTPGVLPAVLDGVRQHPGFCVVVPGLRLEPDELLRLDPYGSNLLPDRVRTRPNPHADWADAALAAWDAGAGFWGDPELAMELPAYLQGDRVSPGKYVDVGYIG